MNDVTSIQKRNERVEADKEWETSWTRRLIIAALTYVIVSTYLHVLEVERAYLHAFVPTGAYLLSTMGLNYIKVIWTEKIYKKKAS